MSHTRPPYKASKTNWRGEPVEHDVYISGDFREDFEGRYSTSVAIVLGNATSGTIADETAEFIVRACNSHDDLLAALQRIASIRKDFGSTNGMPFALLAAEQIACDALAKAKTTPYRATK